MRCRVPDHRDGRPCLPVHHRLSPLAWASSPPSGLLSPGSTWVCWTVSRRFPIRAGPRGRRYPLAFVLALAACAVLAGAMSLSAITEWAADAPPAVLTALGGRVREPTEPTDPAEATILRVLQRVDGDALDTAIGAWLATRDSDRWTPDQRRSLAVDGKTIRGAWLDVDEK
ncbi:transposase family protein [Streptomyces sp. NPDC088747]|uniref:transposase family protein n=1 Tax=Streptomyces sp. NPDC088747 TaxID=3365886 RepID=UPI00382B8578